MNDLISIAGSLALGLVILAASNPRRTLREGRETQRYRWFAFSLFLPVIVSAGIISASVPALKAACDLAVGAVSVIGLGALIHDVLRERLTRG